jgi:hypothetical protein
MLRKQILSNPSAAGAPRADVKDIPALATVFVTSEAPGHPVDYLFDASGGPGGTRWMAGADGEQTLVLAFDAPQTIRAIGIEAEEPSATRTNVLVISLSGDGGRTYQERIRQEFNFSQPGTTFEREEWAVPAERITHVRVVIQPDKGHAPHRATLTSLTVR